MRSLERPIPAARGVEQREHRERDDVRRHEVAGAAQTLSPLLDPSWKSYLALPAEIYRPGAQPHPDSLQSALNRYDRVAKDPQYRVLSSRAEFQSLYDLLQQYERTLADRRAALDLPPPPSNTVERR